MEFYNISAATATANAQASASCLSAEIPQKDHKGLWIFGESESKRRVIFIEKRDGSYGFTLQSYGVRYKHGNRETDFITYVNAVEKDGAAHQAGLQEGDVILSINGQNMARVEHKSLVGFIRKCPTHLKMIVVSDERARKVELHMRYVHLQKKLQDKIKELEELNWREKQILAGVYKNPCGTPLGVPCLKAAASTVCCFCPSHSRSSKSETTVFDKDGLVSGTNILYIGSEFEEAKLQQVLQQRSKSVKVSDKERGKSSGTEAEPSSQYYYDCYRKCQSSRELHSNNSNKEPNNPFGRLGSQTKDPSSSTNKLPSTSGTPAQGRAEAIKPKSWDNLIGTKSYGGYGYGFGYGYFPSNKDVAQTHGAYPDPHVTHPHHHNHHSHCSHPRSSGGAPTNDYYYNPQEAHGSKGPRNDPGRQKVKVVYNYVAPTYHTMMRNESRSNIPTSSVNSSITNVVIPNKYSTAEASRTIRSKTLPSLKKPPTGKPSSTNEVSFPTKLEKTFSDSSLSDHHKEFPKTMSYFRRSGDNVRFSSDEEDEMYGVESKREHPVPSRAAVKKEKEHIFV